MTSDVRAALDAGDDGFHEIQLNGKQLVFLGMATTLVSVVIFLCGVLVGRGVKPLDTVAQAAGPQAFETPASSPVAPGAIATPAPAPSGGDGTAAAAAAPAAASAGDTEPTPLGDDPDPAAPPPASDVAAPARAAAAPARPPAIEPKTPKAEPRAAAKPVPAPVQASAAPPAPVAAPKPPTPAPPAVAATAPAGGGQIAVQVGAFGTRREADALAKKLSGRGYAVYVMNPIDDGKNVYRVRVGNYTSADEAQRVSARLTQQEKLKPWITR
jgi:cell division septation protein DedD